MAYIDKWRSLSDRGYLCVPIKAGYKYPAGLDAWEDMSPTEDDWNTWVSGPYSDGGVGIVLGKGTSPIGAIDIDVYDPEVASMLGETLEFEYGLSLRRVGEAPKVLYPYLMEEPLRKLATARYVIEGDGTAKASRVEALGLGQQFVAYGIHPDTQKPYTWYSGTLENTCASDLVTLSAKDVTGLINLCDGVLSRHGRRISSSPSGAKAQSLGSYYNHRRWKPLNLDDEEVLRILSYLPKYYTSSYDDWLQVGFALHHQYNGEVDGLALWDVFSQQDEYGYNKPDAHGRVGLEALSAKWDSFSTERQGNTVTLRQLRRVARANDMPDKAAQAEGSDTDEVEDPEACDPLDVMLRRYIYVAKDKLVYDRQDEPVAEDMLKLDEFHAQKANVVSYLVDAAGKERIVPVSKQWMTHENRVSVQGTRYHPEAGLIITDHNTGKRYMNTCSLPEFEMVDTNDYKKIHIFLDHIAYLCPRHEDREMFLDFMAIKVQRPGYRPAVTPLHMTPLQGTGRSYIGYLLEKLFGTGNVGVTDLAALAGVGPGGNFQEFLVNTVMVIVNEAELDEAQKAKVGGMLKTVLTDKFLNLNVKYGSKGTREVFAGVMLFTNKQAPMDFDPNDRRIHVIEGPATLNPPAYYRKLYNALDDIEYLNEVYTYLMSREVDPEKYLMRAVMTPAKQAMIKTSGNLFQNVMARMLEDLAEDHPGLTLGQLTHALIRRQRTDMKSALEVSDQNVRASLRKLNTRTVYLSDTEIYVLRSAEDDELLDSVHTYDEVHGLGEPEI